MTEIIEAIYALSAENIAFRNLTLMRCVKSEVGLTTHSNMNNLIIRGEITN